MECLVVCQEVLEVRMEIQEVLTVPIHSKDLMMVEIILDQNLVCLVEEEIVAIRIIPLRVILEGNLNLKWEPWETIMAEPVE